MSFALENPSLYLLMFGSYRLDGADAALARARQGAFDLLAGGQPDRDALIRAAGSWSRVHGLALLAIDGQLEALGVRAGLDTGALVRAVLGVG